jgi:prepilin-type N-terminal cleavage/methylation domain-containing protein
MKNEMLPEWCKTGVRRSKKIRRPLPESDKSTPLCVSRAFRYADDWTMPSESNCGFMIGLSRISFLNRSRAFTLVELLVVIGIIVVLAALVFAVSRSVLKNADAGRGVSNLRMVVAATLNYANDNGTCIPRANALINGRRRSWDVQLAPYLGVDSEELEASADFRVPMNKIAKVFFSPRDKQPLLPGSPSFASRRSWSMPNASYAATAEERLAQRIARNFNEDSLRLISVAEPANTLLFVELHRSQNIVGDNSDAISLFPVDVSAQRQADQGRTSKFIYGFMDGSVRFIEGIDTVGTGQIRRPRGAWTATAAD